MNEKRRSHRDSLLALLGDGREHGMAECLQTAGFRYGARIFELRRQGYEIETIQHGADDFAYRLIREGQAVLL